MLDLKELLTGLGNAIIGKVSKSGDTMTGDLWIERTNAEAYIRVNSKDTNGDSVARAGFAATAGGSAGLYDYVHGNWIIQRQPAGGTVTPTLSLSSTYIAPTTGDNVPYAISADQRHCYLYKIGNIVFMALSIGNYGTSGHTTPLPQNTTLLTIPAAYRPPSSLRCPAQFSEPTGIDYPATIVVNASGTIQQTTSANVIGIYCFGMWQV